MTNKITVKIEAFAFETKYESQDYIKCGFCIKFEEVDREFKILFDNKSLGEILSEIDMYFNGEIEESCQSAYYPPWIVGKYIRYPIAFWIDIDNKIWEFRYKKSQNDPDYDFVYSMSEDDVRSMRDQMRQQYDAIGWEALGRSDLYTFDTPKKDFEWCYSASVLQEVIAARCGGREIRAIYVCARNYSDPLSVRTNFVNYYLGSEVFIEFDEVLINLLIHAQGLFEWRCFDKKDVKIIMSRSKLIENGGEEFSKIGNVYDAFELEYLDTPIVGVSVEATDYHSWAAHGFDDSRLSDPVELPERLDLMLANGNTLSFTGWDDDFVISIGQTKED